MTHPAFVERAREVDQQRLRDQAADLYDRLEPAWYAEALCRGRWEYDPDGSGDHIPVKGGGRGTQRLGATWEAAFPEDTALRDPEMYPSTRDVREVMETCAACPVRRRCLASAIRAEAEPITLGSVWFYVSHEPRCDDNTCTGCVDVTVRLRYKLFEAEAMPSGIYGGVPGKVRSWFAMVPCPDCLGLGYHPGFILAGIDVGYLAAEFHRKPGWPCATCEATGRIRNPNLEADCHAWFTREAERQGWPLDDEGTVAV